MTTHGMAELGYTDVPARLNGPREGLRSTLLRATSEAALLALAGRPARNRDGDVEMLGAARVLHRFVDVPGDGGDIRWHFVEAGEGEPVVLLHGLPESWFVWHRQIDDLARDHRVVAIDLKGCGQSQKSPGDYRPEGVAEQIVALFDVLGLDRVNLVARDLGATVADYLGASHPLRVRRYARGQQHLYHFNESLLWHEGFAAEPVGSLILGVPPLFVAAAFAMLAHHPVSPRDLRRTTQEWSFPGIGAASARYFQSSSPRKEWVDRRTRLLAHWRFPVLILQGERDPLQPREFYEDVAGTMPDAVVHFLDAGHFFVHESPQQTTSVLREFLSR